MLRFAVRNLFRQKARTAMTLAAVVLGVVAIVLSGGFVEDVYIQLRDSTIHSRLGYLQVYDKGFYEYGRRNPFEHMIADAEKLVSELSALPGVVDILQRVSFSGLLNNGRTDQGIIGEGVEADKEAALGGFLSIIDGRQLSDQDAYGVLVGEGVARSLALEPGNFVTLLANTSDGAMNSVELEVIGVFRTFSKDYDARAVRVPLATAAELVDSTAIHALVFSLADAALTERVTAQIRARLPVADYEVMTWLELDDFYPKTVALYQRQFGVLQIIILGIVLLSVANSVNMTAHERTGEFGTLRALGRRGGYVFRLIVIENTFLAIIGGTLGLAIGVLLAWAVSNVGIPMPPPPNANSGYIAHIRIVPSVLLMAFVVGTGATILSALLPARGAARKSIVDALRYNI